MVAGPSICAYADAGRGRGAEVDGAAGPADPAGDLLVDGLRGGGGAGVTVATVAVLLVVAGVVLAGVVDGVVVVLSLAADAGGVVGLRIHRCCAGRVCCADLVVLLRMLSLNPLGSWRPGEMVLIKSRP